METLLTEFINNYGLTLFLIALSGIVLLGILKFFRVFDKITKENRKYFYAGISASLSIIATIIYLVVSGDITLTTVLVIAPATYTLNQAAYALYETTGLRKVLRSLGNVIVTLLAKSRIEKAQKELETTQLEPVAVQN